MIITVPNTDSYPTTFADWLELSVLNSENHEVTILNIRDLLDFDDVEADAKGHSFDEAIETHDLQEAQDEIDIVIESFYEEIDNRVEYLKESYPYEVKDSGLTLKLKKNLNLGSYVYLFCLILSNGSRDGLIEKPDNFITNNERDLFQLCSTICAAGIIKGPSCSMGWPRPDSSAFLDKMKKFHEDLSPGIKIRPTVLPGTPAKIKDAGIDVISYKPEPDGTSGIAYFLGQAASGKNWKDKSAETEIKKFLYLYYEQDPHNPKAQMFIPFCIAAEHNKDISFQERAKMEIEIQTRRLGQLYYRYRLPYYVKEAENLETGKKLQIERFDERSKIIDWVDDFIA